MNLQERYNSLSTKAKWGIGLLAAFVISPVIFAVVQGIAGLIVAWVLGLAIVNLAPVLSAKFANWKIKGIKAEARQNPIETMENLLIAKRQAFREFQANVTTAAAARNTFKTRIEAFASRYPARAREFEEQLERMTDLVERKKRALVDAEKMLDDGQHKLDEMKAYWEMSQAAQAANKAAGMDTGDLYERLKADTACDAVFDSMNKAFAELEVAASLDVNELNRPAQISANSGSAMQDVIYQPDTIKVVK